MNYPACIVTQKDKLQPAHRNFQVFTIPYAELASLKQPVGIIKFPSETKLEIDRIIIDCAIFDYYRPFIWSESPDFVFHGDLTSLVTVAVAEIFVEIFSRKMAILYPSYLIQYPAYLLTFTHTGLTFPQLFLPARVILTMIESVSNETVETLEESSSSSTGSDNEEDEELEDEESEEEDDEMS